MLKKMIDNLLSIIPFDSIRKWLSDNPEVALLLFIFVLLFCFVGGMHIA